MDNKSNGKPGAPKPKKASTRKPAAKKGKLQEFKDTEYANKQMDRIIFALDSFRKGDSSVRLVKERDDKFSVIAESFNSMVDLVSGVNVEVSRISKVAGVEGNLTAKASHKEAEGIWFEVIDSINLLIDSIASPTLEVGRILHNISKGNLKEKFDLTVAGDFKVMSETINNTVDSLSTFSDEVSRVALEVGTEGMLGGRADVPNVAGTWKVLTRNVNDMATNLTNQVREISTVASAVAKGDLSQKITINVKGEVDELKTTINEMVDNLNSFSNEVKRVAHEIGTEGKLGGQATVEGVSGRWRELTDNVNLMANNITVQVREIAEVTVATANGNLTKTISEIGKGGEVLALSREINSMNSQLNTFATEVSRIAREIGTDGQLGGQAKIEGVKGTWKDLTTNVNIMAANLTSQVREIAVVASATAKGDLDQLINEEGKEGEVKELAVTINTMNKSLQLFSSEVTKVAKEIGVEGKLGGQANVNDVHGVWKELTDNVNVMAANLTSQVREIAKVATGTANGNLAQLIIEEGKDGEVLQLAKTVNTMNSRLNTFASEVTRVAKEIGTEGVLGGQANVNDVSGVWKDLTDNVNLMASNLTIQVREIAVVATATAKGDLKKTIIEEGKAGEVLELAKTINAMNQQLDRFGTEVTRVAREIGTEGQLGGKADVEEVRGVWKALTDNVNIMAANLTSQVREIAHVATATANGNLTESISEEGKAGEVLDLAQTINSMNGQLDVFAREVTRVAKEIGTDGILGGQAEVENIDGVWKELTDNVNTMANNLTSQVREISAIASSTAKGDLEKRVVEEGKSGEVLDLAKTLNVMNKQLGVFAEEVIKVADQVGNEGNLGVQAEVPGVSGSWKKLTDKVNGLAGNLTTQVRDISRVTAAVAMGDLTQKIEVNVKGEILQLKNTINDMVDVFGGVVNSANKIASGDFLVETESRGEKDELGKALNTMTKNLRDISEENESERWLKTGQSGLNDKMRGEQNTTTVSRNIITFLCKYLDAKVGVMYLMDENNEKLNLTSSYAFTKRKGLDNSVKVGEGLVGQAAFEKEIILLTEVPKDYISVSSGLGEKTPKNILVTPFILEGNVLGVLELGAFEPFTERVLILIRSVTENVAIAINSSRDRDKMRTLLDKAEVQASELQKQQDSLKTLNEELEEQTTILKDSEEQLKIQSDELTITNKELEEQATILKDSEEQLKLQSEELTVTNEELEEKADELEGQKRDIEAQNKKINIARIEVEEKARELTLSSKYKSEFLANMSHELRTPLNSLLILSGDLAENSPGNLTPTQVKDAQVIQDGGKDLLNLINDILDLSKVEAGKLRIQIEDVKVNALVKTFKNNFDPVAKKKKIKFTINQKSGIPLVVQSDSQRIEQIIKNLLSNAFKFTSKGGVTIDFHTPDVGVKFKNSNLTLSRTLAITVSDTGIGIPKEKQRAIFEAFQQADGGTSRKYGGTGLGLTISRELTKLLQGELQVGSEEGKGSQFTLYIPYSAQELVEEETLPVSSPAFAPIDYSDGQIQLIEKEKPFKPTVFIADDRNDLDEEDNVVLIIEDDSAFAETLLDITRKKGYKGIVTMYGKEGIDLAKMHQPQGIVLDMSLPDIEGLKVLDNLKFDLKTRHIPVHIVSAHNQVIKTLQKGAVGYLKKPATKDGLNEVFNGFEKLQAGEVKRLLIVEDDKTSRDAMNRLLKNKAINIKGVGTAADALATLMKSPYDCIVLDLNLPDMSGFELLKLIKANKKIETLPVIIYTGKDLTEEEYAELQKYSESIVVKGVNSPERLFDEVTLFLHSVEENLSQRQKKIIHLLHDPQLVLKGKKVLLADDDVRNTYALSKILKQAGLEVILADNGKTAIEKLKKETDTDLILMDIMMPEMDGYEATREIRKMAQFKNIPIIALTAKAMPEDKAKCIDAGANDYLTKPVNLEILLSMLRVWLFEKQ